MLACPPKSDSTPDFLITGVKIRAKLSRLHWALVLGFWGWFLGCRFEFWFWFWVEGVQGVWVEGVWGAWVLGVKGVLGVCLMKWFFVKDAGECADIFVVFDLSLAVGREEWRSG